MVAEAVAGAATDACTLLMALPVVVVVGVTVYDSERRRDGAAGSRVVTRGLTQM